MNQQAHATANISDDGKITSITLTDPGFGYDSAPAVTISAHVPGTGTGATAIADIGGGIVTNILVTNAGSGYTRGNTPDNEVSAPSNIEVNVKSGGTSYQNIYLGTGKREIEN
ncbi:MAG: hypothetical protein HY738_06400 [Bacteroidia bacterium]|nr:hypothetical protein [Bacteroidia bacterium]